MSKIITNEDLYKNKYSYETLKTNIYAVSLLDILKTQTLTSKFCVKYILNPDFHFIPSDNAITVKDVLKYQKHITFDDLVIAQVKINTSLTRGEKSDSIDDFEIYAEKHI
jgi:hypothetical protein